MSRLLLGIDVGTTGTKSLLFSEDGRLSLCLKGFDFRLLLMKKQIGRAHV